MILIRLAPLVGRVRLQISRGFVRQVVEMSQWKMVLVAVVLVVAGVANGGGFADRVSAYVAMQDGCGLVDGYVCSDALEDDFLSGASQERMVLGNYLKAWQVALEDFNQLAVLDDEQKNLKHYKIGFTESAVHYIVLFQALLLPSVGGDGVMGGVNSTVGRTMRYWINKESMTVDRQLFYK